jgi:hypothetical protein
MARKPFAPKIRKPSRETWGGALCELRRIAEATRIADKKVKQCHSR